MTESIPELTPAPTPFIIRGHHLSHLERVLRKNPDSPHITAEQTRLACASYAQPDPKLPHGYYTDVYGTEPGAADAAIAGEVAFFTEFIDLPSDYPVKLVTNQKDGICNSCVVGLHCGLKEVAPSMHSDGDEGFIRAFRASAVRLGRSDETTELVETATYVDGTPRRVPALQTTAGVVREVLNDDWFLEPTQAKARLPRLRRAMYAATPEEYHRNHPSMLGKISPLSRPAAAAMLFLALQGSFHAGKAYQAHKSSQVTAASYDEQAAIRLASEKETVREQEGEALEEFGILAVVGVVRSLAQKGRREDRKLLHATYTTLAQTR